MRWNRRGLAAHTTFNLRHKMMKRNSKLAEIWDRNFLLIPKRKIFTTQHPVCSSFAIEFSRDNTNHETKTKRLLHDSKPVPNWIFNVLFLFILSRLSGDFSDDWKWLTADFHKTIHFLPVIKKLPQLSTQTWHRRSLHHAPILALKCC